MSFLGYDPNRLQALRRAVHELVDEQTGIHSDDPLGREAAMLARNELAKIASWTVRIDQIVDCVFGSPYRPVSTGTGPNRASPYDATLIGIVRPWDPSWLLTLDPTTAFAADIETLGGELGTWLAHTDISNVVDDHERAAALTALFNRVAADPAAAEAFANALGPVGLSWQTTRLAGLLTAAPQQATTTTPTAGRFQDEAEMLDALARIVSTALSTGHIDGGVLLGSLIGSDAYAAISLVSRLTVPAAQLGELATSIWARASNLTEAGRGLEVLVPLDAPKTVDLLIALFAREPEAARIALTEMSDDAYVALLAQGDGEAIGRMLVNLIEPSLDQTKKSSSAAMVGRLLSTLDQSPGLRSPELVGFVGVIAGPWLPELVRVEDTSSGYPLVPIDLDGRSPEHVLRWLAENKDAARSLVVWMTAIGQTATARIGDAENSRAQFHHLGEIIGAAGEAIKEALVRHAQHRKDVFESLWGTGSSLLSNIVTAMDVFDGPVGIAANMALNWAFQEFGDKVLRERVFGIKPTAAVSRDQIARAVAFEVSMMSTVAMVFYMQLVEHGALPATVEPPPYPSGEEATRMDVDRYHNELAEWQKRQLAAGPTPLSQAQRDAIDRLGAAVDAETLGFVERMPIHQP